MAGIPGRRLGLASAALGLATGTMAAAIPASAAPMSAGCLRACPVVATAAAAPAIMRLNGVSASSSSSAWAVGA